MKGPIDISFLCFIILTMSKNQKVLMWVILSLVAIGLWCLFYFVRGFYSLIGAMDACTFSGIVVLFSYLLVVVYRLGAFDMIVFGFKDLFYHANRSQTKIAKYDDYGDYREKKKEARRRSKPYFYPFLGIGAALIVISIIIRIIMLVNTGY